MRRRKILYFMPDSPVRKDAGNKTHTLQMLEYFNNRHRHIELDYVGEKYWGQWTDDDVAQFKDLFPYCNLSVLERKMPKENKLKYFLKYKLPLFVRKRKWLIKGKQLPDNNTHLLQLAFNKLLKNKEYDYIIISYVTWATLIEKNPYLKGARLICDTHDFMTAQLKEKKNFRLGHTLEREMGLLSLFDEVWSLSTDEKYLFSQFLTTIKHRFIPVMLNNKYQNAREVGGTIYDLLFIGSENEHNIKSLNWFFSEVYPQLSENLNICIVGKIVDHIGNFKNVEKKRFVDNLDKVYYQSKVALCPMLSGTGIKIKTVEALSYGLPVVCNYRGMDGLPIKDSNGCLRADSPEAFAFHINSLLGDDFVYQTTRAQAIRMFNKYFDKKKGYQNLDQILKIVPAEEGRKILDADKVVSLTKEQ